MSGLVRLTAEADVGRFAGLVESHRPMVFRWALGLVGDADEADDVAQEVFVRVFEQLGRFRGDGSFEGWLYRITRRIAVRRARTVARRRQLASSPAARRTDEVYLTDPGARVDRQAAAGAIHEAYLGLPLRQREVFALCDLDGLTPGAVATLLQLNPATVRANLFKARTTVRRMLLSRYPTLAEGDHDVR